MYTFEKSVEIKCDIDELFKFHLDTNNLPLISPPFPKAFIVKISDVPLKEGSQVIVSLNFIFSKSEWEILIEKVIQNKLIIDLQQKGIFEYWRHSHIFEPKGDRVLMSDKIEFIPPFGLLGKLSLPLIKLQLRLMFNYRHKKTKMIFES